MSEYLEFKDEEIPEENPNPKNNIYRVAGTSDADAVFVVGIVVAFFFILCGIYYRDDIATLLICMTVGSIYIFVFGSYLYDKHFFQKRLIQNGVAYPAVVIRSFSYTKRMGSPNASSMKYTEYGIEVKYAKGTREFKGYDADNGKYLENPYCTVYEWNDRIMVADFKVRDEYISADGKSYSLKPKRRK